ncbi:MAG: ADP-ribosylglycohydrolase family protein [Halioglobus sp.]
MKLIDRYNGALLGLAVGDALGTTLEFKSPGSFELIDDMVGGGPFALQPGEWTDDTSMALCLAESLIQQQGFNPADQMARYVRWMREGHLSPTGTCFDIGITVAGALRQFEKTGEAYAGSTDPYSAGNGSLMRLAPIPMAYRSKPELLWDHAAKSSATTHGAQSCLDACGYYADLIAKALDGASREELLSAQSIPDPMLLPNASTEISEVASGSYKSKEPPQIKGTGYVVEALEAAMWAFYKTSNFRDGALLAVNLGNDADTTGAIYGQLAGAYYGEQGIPEGWREKIAMKELIAEYAEALLEFSQQA